MENAMNETATASTETSKQVVVDFYDAMNSRDVERILATYTPDAKTWVLGDNAFSGEHPVTREGIEQFLQYIDIRFTIVSLIAEGNTVAVELESEGTAGGQPYGNRYHNLFNIRDGRVAYLKEYFDTARAGG